MGGPPILIGSWYSGPWVKRAAMEYDGWLSSSAWTNFNTVAEGLKRYRDMGGKRAMVATIGVDLTQPEADLADDKPFHLRCGPKSAAERLQRLADLGYDDALIVEVRRAHRGGHDGRRPGTGPRSPAEVTGRRPIR